MRGRGITLLIHHVYKGEIEDTNGIDLLYYNCVPKSVGVS